MSNDSQPDSLENVATALFKDGMSKVAAPVHVITTDGAAGLAGMTATAVSSVTDTPPMLLVCMNRSSRVTEITRQNRVFAVNTLRATQEELSAAFAGQRGTTTMEERFAFGEWSKLKTGAPALRDSIVTFDCVIDEIVESGTHSVVYGRIVDVAVGADGPALMYHARRYFATP